jgi:hypothetical protein
MGRTIREELGGDENPRLQIVLGDGALGLEYGPERS